MANNNFPQVTSVTSEALQAQIRTLLPSQEGFGTDLMAQNVIVPIIDLTSAAEGSSVPQILQTAMSFGSQSVFTANNSTAVIANTAGFWSISAISGMKNGSGAASNTINLSDGLTNKAIFKETKASNESYNSLLLEFVVFLESGDSLSAVSDTANNYIQGTARQIADVNGVLINPSGFSPQ